MSSAEERQMQRVNVAVSVLSGVSSECSDTYEVRKRAAEVLMQFLKQPEAVIPGPFIAPTDVRKEQDILSTVMPGKTTQTWDLPAHAVLGVSPAMSSTFVSKKN